MVSVAPDRSTGWVRMAGHLPPLLLTGGGVQELQTPTSPPLGLSRVHDWPGTPVRLDGGWSVLLYTDGLIEGRIGRGSERLGSEGLMELIREALRAAPPAEGNGESGPGGTAADGDLLDRVIERVRELNGGDLGDDLAILALSFSPGR
jgi:serine phosphatase RsbU (regulator of sigma subunit)